jgi:staphylococcal nuclease domain-containing protein 1
MASKANNNVDDPGAFSSREWLRNMCVGKTVTFETRKQGASAGERVYGLLFMPDPSNKSNTWNLSVESVRRGFCTPKVLGGDGSATEGGEDENGVEDYEQAWQCGNASGTLWTHSLSMGSRLFPSGNGTPS